MLELYENIKKYRIKKGLSQLELAKKIGYTDRSTIAKIEHGDIDLSRSKIMAFAKALGVSASELMGNTGINQHELKEDEKEVLNGYNRLNEEAQKEALNYITYLASKPENLNTEGKSSLFVS